MQRYTGVFTSSGILRGSRFVLSETLSSGNRSAFTRASWRRIQTCASIMSSIGSRFFVMTRTVIEAALDGELHFWRDCRETRQPLPPALSSLASAFDDIGERLLPHSISTGGN